MSVYLVLLIVAAVLGFVGIVRSRGDDLAAWGVLVLAVALWLAR